MIAERYDAKSLHNCSNGLFLPQHPGSIVNLRERLRVRVERLVLCFIAFGEYTLMQI